MKLRAQNPHVQEETWKEAVKKEVQTGVFNQIEFKPWDEVNRGHLLGARPTSHLQFVDPRHAETCVKEGAVPGPKHSMDMPPAGRSSTIGEYWHIGKELR